MSIPPLPLVDGQLLVDNSFVEAVQTCSAYAAYNRLYKRIGATGRPALDFGSAIHLALEWRYKNCKAEAPTMLDEELQIELLSRFFENHPVDIDEHRNLDHAVDIVKHYNQCYSLEPFQLLAYVTPVVCGHCGGRGWVSDTTTCTPTGNERRPCLMCAGTGKTEIMAELPFMVPLFTASGNIPVHFIGKIDLPVQWDSGIYIGDHKTGGMAGGVTRFMAEHACSWQPLGYCYAFEETTQQKVAGFFINGIGTKTPPQYVLDPSKRRGTQKTPEQWWSEMFPRHIEHLALRPNWKQEWKNDAIECVEQFLWHFRRGFFPTNGRFVRACERYDGCQYKEVCSQGTDEKRAEALKGVGFIDNTWSPLREAT